MNGVITSIKEPVGIAEVRDPIEWAAYIERLEAILLNFPQVDCPVTHRFLPGIYMREVYIPAGMFAIGHAHRDRCFDIVLQGRGRVVLNGQLVDVQAPSVGISEPFSRKIGYISEPMRWITVHATQETDVEKLEEMLLQKSDSFLRHEKSLSPDKLSRDHDSYLRTLEILGVTEDQVQLAVMDLSDAVDFLEKDGAGVYFGNSPIHGMGMFATRTLKLGDTICTARVGDCRTPAGRFTNHSATPNTEAILESDTVIYRATETIYLGSEITLDYRQTRETTHTL